jgi:Cell morphogenesis central region
MPSHMCLRSVRRCLLLFFAHHSRGQAKAIACWLSAVLVAGCAAAGGREHPELSEPLCIEVMTRCLDAEGAAAANQHAMLTCLKPWMENLSFAASWEGA